MVFIGQMKTKRGPASLVFVKTKEDIACEDLNTVVGHELMSNLLIVKETEYVVSKPCLIILCV